MRARASTRGLATAASGTRTHERETEKRMSEWKSERERKKATHDRMSQEVLGGESVAQDKRCIVRFDHIYSLSR